MPIAQSRIFSAALLLFLPYLGQARSQSHPQLSPTDLVKAVINNEVNATNTTDVRWHYRLEKDVDGKQEAREVVETKTGSLDRLIAVAGKPLNEAQQRTETERILRLSHNAIEQHKIQQRHQKDVQQCDAFLQMIPNAFVFENGGISGELTKVLFRPSPTFQPSSIEGRILHQMSGEIWINATQQRLVSITGQLMNQVKFAGGLLGHLEKGGQFMVKRIEVSPGHWELAQMNVNMQGKALLFKTIAVQQKELRTNFHAIADDLTLSDAAGLLLKEVFVAKR